VLELDGNEKLLVGSGTVVRLEVLTTDEVGVVDDGDDAGELGVEVGVTVAVFDVAVVDGAAEVTGTHMDPPQDSPIPQQATYS
jgi:hypothetical protein